MRVPIFSVLLCALAMVLPGIAAPVPAAGNGRYIDPADYARSGSAATPPSSPPEHDAAVHALSARDVSTGAVVGVGVGATAGTALIALGIHTTTERQARETTTALGEFTNRINAEAAEDTKALQDQVSRARAALGKENSAEAKRILEEVLE